MNKKYLYIIYVLIIIGLTSYFGVKIISGKFENFIIQIPPPIVSVFRNIEKYSLTKTNNTIRIAAVGDSFTFGAGVEENETYTKILENMLNQNNTRITYEVLNFGIPGGNMQEKIKAFIKNATPYSPDFVIIQLHGGDTNNITRIIEIYHDLIKQNISKSSKEIENNKILIDLEKKARLLWAKELMKKSDKEINELEKEFIKKPLKELTNITEKNHISVLLLYIPDCPGISYAGREYIIEPFIKEYNWHYLNLEKVYKHFKKSDLILSISPEDCHPSQFAHRLIAEEIYKKLISEKLLPTQKGD
jgi:lysophospholipase L1-like esterase